MENLEENFKRNKEDSNTLKQEKKKYENEIKHLKSSQLSSSLKPLNSLKVPGKSLKSPTPKSNQLEPNPLLSQTLEKNFQQVDLVSASTSLLSPLLDKQVAVVSASTTLLSPMLDSMQVSSVSASTILLSPMLDSNQVGLVSASTTLLSPNPMFDRDPKQVGMVSTADTIPFEKLQSGLDLREEIKYSIETNNNFKVLDTEAFTFVYELNIAWFF